jgi:hypothetical protein
MTATDLMGKPGQREIIIEGQANIEKFADFCEKMPMSIIPVTNHPDLTRWAKWMRGGKVRRIVGTLVTLPLGQGATVFAHGCKRNWTYEPAEVAAEVGV